MCYVTQYDPRIRFFMVQNLFLEFAPKPVLTLPKPMFRYVVVGSSGDADINGSEETTIVCSSRHQAEYVSLHKSCRVWCIELVDSILRGNRRCHVHSLEENVFLAYNVIPPQGAGDLASAVETVFLIQHQFCVKKGMLDYILSRLDGHAAISKVCTTLDLETVSRGFSDLQIFYEQLLLGFLPKQLPIDLASSWNWTKRSHLMPFLFGGKVVFGRSSSHSSMHNKKFISYIVPTVELAFEANVLGTLNYSVLQMYAVFRKIPSSTTKEDLPVTVQSYISTHGKLKSYRLITYDIESTGLNVKHDRIAEIALYDCSRDMSFSSLVNPEVPMPSSVVLFHGLTDDVLAQAPRWNKVCHDMLQFLDIDPTRNEILIFMAHNGTKFDEPMLRRHMSEANVDVPNCIVFADSLGVFKYVKNGCDGWEGDLKLFSVMDKFNVIATGDQHRALSDARGIWDVLVRMVEPCLRDLTSHVGDSTSGNYYAEIYHEVLVLIGKTFELEWTKVLSNRDAGDSSTLNLPGDCGVTVSLSQGIFPSTEMEAKAFFENNAAESENDDCVPLQFPFELAHKSNFWDVFVKYCEATMLLQSLESDTTTKDLLSACSTMSNKNIFYSLLAKTLRSRFGSTGQILVLTVDPIAETKNILSKESVLHSREGIDATIPTGGRVFAMPHSYFDVFTAMSLPTQVLCADLLEKIVTQLLNCDSLTFGKEFHVLSVGGDALCVDVQSVPLADRIVGIARKCCEPIAV
eukprot:PhF_6_TR26328/c0_g1_i1/m.37858